MFKFQTKSYMNEMNTLKVNDGNQRKLWGKLKMGNHIWGKWE